MNITRTVQYDMAGRLNPSMSESSIREGEMYPYSYATNRPRAFRGACLQLAALVLSLTGGAVPMAVAATGEARSATGLTVTIPNGYAHIDARDMQLMATAGEVRWGRVWDGQEWKFQPHWESLSQTWKNFTGSAAADVTSGTVTSGNGGTLTSSSGGSGGADSGCWVWVDEDWSPSIGSTLIGGVPEAAPVVPARTLPFNRLMGEASADYPPVQRVSVDFASLCAGSSLSGGAAFRDTEGIRRINELYLGESGRYAFNNRSVLEKRSVLQLAQGTAATLYAELARGTIELNPEENAKGFRWTDRGGEWIDYNTQGQVVAYGDRNNNAVWMVRDGAGILRGVVDGNGRVLWSLHYTGELLTEIRDYPASDIPDDLPARSVKYQYDGKNRLVKVTDVRGYDTKYEYDAGNRIVAVTDQEGRTERLVYGGDTVQQRIAPDGGVTDYLFDYDETNKQFVSKITGPETSAGRKVREFTHNRVGLPVRTLVNGRTQEELRYDTGARTTLMTDARGFTTRVVRNEFDQIIELDKPDGSVMKRSFSAQNLSLLEEQDSRSTRRTSTYDERANLVEWVEAVGLPEERHTTFKRDALGKVVAMTRKGRMEANGVLTQDARWSFEYDRQGQITAATDPRGQQTRYTFDRTGALMSYSTPLGGVVRVVHDAGGNVTARISPLGQRETYSYDKVGNQTGRVDARNSAQTIWFDAMNRPVQRMHALNGLVKVEYDAVGSIVSARDEDQLKVWLRYDNFGRITEQRDDLNNIVKFGYEIDSGEGASQAPLRLPSQLEFPTYKEIQRFDALGRLTLQKVDFPTAQGERFSQTEFSYDAAGSPSSVTGPNGYSRTYQYDAFGQLIAFTDSTGGGSKFLRDVDGRILEFKDAEGKYFRFRYDANGQMTQKVLPMGQSFIYEYDADGRLVTQIDPRGTRTQFKRDLGGRVQEIQYQDASATATHSTVLEWDDGDHLTAWRQRDAEGRQVTAGAIRYDALGRKTYESVTYPSGAQLHYQYGYSLSGRKTSLIWPDGSVIGYRYSKHGQLEEVSVPGEGTMAVSAFEWTSAKAITLPGGSVQLRQFDGLRRLEGLQVRTAGQAEVLSLKNTYDAMQQVVERSRVDTVDQFSSATQEKFKYDANGQLIETVGGADSGVSSQMRSLKLDRVGNRVLDSQKPGSWTYDANNRLIKVGDVACGTIGSICLSWDDAGNLTRKVAGPRVQNFTYDEANRLIEVSNARGDTVARYGYDPFGRRIWKERHRTTDDVALDPPQRTLYLYSEEGLLAEAEDRSNVGSGDQGSQSLVITAQYGVRPNVRYGTEVLFVKATALAGDFSVAYYQNDHLGVPIQAIDRNGQVLWSAVYDAFGIATLKTLGSTMPASVAHRLRLPGQYWDEESGLHYNWNRYYDPELGRYVQADPIGLEGGANSYVYAKSNPINRIDPEGLLDVFIGGANDANSEIVKSYEKEYARINAGQRDSIYFEHSQREEAIKAIQEAKKKNPCEPINIIGHSWGGASAAAVSQELSNQGIQVDLLVTVDPVGREYSRKEGKAKIWQNINATPSSDNGFSGDRWARWGGKWGDWPNGKANYHYDAPYHHNEFGDLFENVPEGGKSGRQRLQESNSTECTCPVPAQATSEK